VRSALDVEHSLVRATDIDTVTCRCGITFPDDGSIIDHQLDECPYERCDSNACRALRQPSTLAEYAAALDHWRSHALYCGCSHGR